MFEFSDIVVVPYQELFERHLGLSVAKGGPVFPDFDELREPRLLRGNCIPVDVLPDYRNPVACGSAYYWGGVFCNQFGHQIADFSTRYMAYREDGLKYPLLLMNKEGGRKWSYQTFPSWFKDLLLYYGFNEANVIVQTEALTVGKLLVAPQAELLNGDIPNEEYLNRLEVNSSRVIGPIKLLGSKLFISRSKFKSNIAGERFIENIFKASGYEIIYPEDYSLFEQLSLYRNAALIVFIEGSALHALQLLGHELSNVAVIVRRKGFRLGESILKSRASCYTYFDCITNDIKGFLKNGNKATGQALSLLDMGGLLNRFVEDGYLESVCYSLEHWHASVEQDITDWLYLKSNSPQPDGSVDNILNDLLATDYSYLHSKAREILSNAPAFNLREHLQNRRRG